MQVRTRSHAAGPRVEQSAEQNRGRSAPAAPLQVGVGRAREWTLQRGGHLLLLSGPSPRPGGPHRGSSRSEVQGEAQPSGRGQLVPPGGLRGPRALLLLWVLGASCGSWWAQAFGRLRAGGRRDSRAALASPAPRPGPHSAPLLSSATCGPMSPRGTGSQVSS